jgi:hypothetical protein
LDQLCGCFDLPGVLFPEGDLPFYTIPVAKAGFATHVALANRIDREGTLLLCAMLPDQGR